MNTSLTSRFMWYEIILMIVPASTKSIKFQWNRKWVNKRNFRRNANDHKSLHTAHQLQFQIIARKKYTENNKTRYKLKKQKKKFGRKIDFDTSTIEISSWNRKWTQKKCTFKGNKKKPQENALCYYVKCTHQHAFEHDKCTRIITK